MRQYMPLTEKRVPIMFRIAAKSHEPKFFFDRVGHIRRHLPLTVPKPRATHGQTKPIPLSQKQIKARSRRDQKLHDASSQNRQCPAERNK